MDQVLAGFNNSICMQHIANVKINAVIVTIVLCGSQPALAMSQTLHA